MTARTGPKAPLFNLEAASPGFLKFIKITNLYNPVIAVTIKVKVCRYLDSSYNYKADTFAGMDMVDRDTLVNATSINQPPATGPRLENSPQSNYDIDEDGREIHKIYHFHNCRTVYVDARSSHSVAMENCANNNVRRVTYHRPKIMDSELTSDTIIHSESHAASNGPITDSLRTCRTYISFSIVMFSGVSLVAVAFLAFLIMKLSSCSIWM
ncbi:hypothetical protein BYT27DRAFT_7275575 [Phlegmacium glaucopus]|nr:hypothetical protein BYT27DRAFT_7275575 [Phlegmacium glaucopus]